MKPLPLPVRVAAGLAVTAIDGARHLPEKLVELPVTVVSQALQLSMRVQQQVTELAIRGDDALATFRSAEETPPWARFDEDELDTEDTVAHRNGSVRSRFDAVDDSAEVIGDTAVVEDGDDSDENETVAEVTDITEATGVDDAPAPPPAPRARSRSSRRGDAPPDALPNYPALSLPQVRARLRRLTLDDLTALLQYERAHEDRPEFINMLTRRIATISDT